MTLETANEIHPMYMRKIFIQILEKFSLLHHQHDTGHSQQQLLLPMARIHTRYLAHMHGAKREFFKNDFVQVLRMI